MSFELNNFLYKQFGSSYELHKFLPFRAQNTRTDSDSTDKNS